MAEEKRYEQYMYSYPHKRAYSPLPETVIGEAFNNLKGQDVTLYVHVPFCSGKCGYCNLFSVAAAEEDLKEQYVEAVCRQAAQYAGLLREEPIHADQVVFGGGTPWLLTINQLERLFSAMGDLDYMDWKACGFDMETSPRETTKEKAEYLKQKGMKRISIGIQSFYDEELRRIYRKHDSSICHQALKILKETGPDCLNIDLIYGIEGQTVKTFGESLSQALAYEPDQLFLYPLYVRRGTLLYGHMEPDEDLQAEMYRYAVNRLTREGYFQTSMRRFVKNGWENAGPGALASGNIGGEFTGEGPAEEGCGFERMLSLGCGGRSYAGDIHFCEPYEVEAGSCRQILHNFVEKDDFSKGLWGYRLNPDEQMRRYVIKNLGFYQGVSEAGFSRHFGKDLYACYEPLWENLLMRKLVTYGNGRWMLTSEGMGDSDRILARWISKEVAGRMKG